ncbi:hypothetical protein [Cryptosporangium arvum]|uniref:DUF1214 domain-containing protein n=1 Tax=Cryptosporangium arvum DSM 44712 TaxID=927661 RepID=A0A010ZWD6_9ACTN|nr:hypothetical protein [Cryptosporangium arvum]EXG81532.1 hypothetical protein CryarDRAFT_2648 [Cryptosporangium arvum DSM 44712]
MTDNENQFLRATAFTQPFADAIVEAEKIIADAPHVKTEQDLLEGYDYLAGSIKASLHMAWAYEREFPFFTQSTGPYTKMALDNPDTLYFNAHLRPEAEYVVTGRRGTTRDLSFQVLSGDYSPAEVPDSPSAFDDRSIDVAADGTFEVRFGPGAARKNYVTLAPGATMLAVREVYSDWATETRGEIRIHRVDTAGGAPTPPTAAQLEKRYAVAGKMLLSRLRTWLQFPEWFYLKLPVNTLTEPRLTPGGLSTQYSSAGHYELPDDVAMVVTVPKSDAPYQGLQLGSRWYISLDYQNHQTSLTTDQAKADPDGLIRFVISEQDPGLTNWIERTGHDRGFVQLRWQRVARAMTAADGPTVELVPVSELADRVPYHQEQRITPEAWAARIAGRQAAVNRRMLG